MDGVGFDALARAIDLRGPRRAALGLFGGGIAALLTRVGPGDVAAKKKRKKKKKKVKFNEFGCVDVGSFCKNGGQCCSGICQGKKGKKKCKAHDQSTCQAGQQENACGGTTVFCQSALGDEGNCNTTTGNAGFCTNSGVCTDCSKDADCTALCGPQAACIVCPDCVGDSGDTTACVGPEPGNCGMV